MDVDEHSESNNNSNKENEQQGNAEQPVDRDEKEGELSSDGVLDDEEFQTKYDALQEQWLNGHTSKEDLDDEECKKYGKHAYIMQYLLKEKCETQDIVFHPKYAYTYTPFEKELILPSMDRAKLDETKARFQSHIDRLESKILKAIKAKSGAAEAAAIAAAAQSTEPADAVEKKEGGWIVPPFSIPIRADIRKFDFAKLAVEQKRLGGRLFDAIMMDPPWQLASANPTRGVALGYNQLQDDIISSIPVQLLQDNGLIFVWVINAKYRLALSLFRRWGYKMIGDIGWVKQTVNRRIANGHGFYLQHAKETCLIGLKGDLSNVNMTRIKGMCSDVIYSERRGQSQKPEEVYQYIEQLVPNGFYMEVFGRRNNLRNGWLTIGNEL